MIFSSYCVGAISIRSDVSKSKTEFGPTQLGYAKMPTSDGVFLASRGVGKADSRSVGIGFLHFPAVGYFMTYFMKKSNIAIVPIPVTSVFWAFTCSRSGEMTMSAGPDKLSGSANHGELSETMQNERASDI